MDLMIYIILFIRLHYSIVQNLKSKDWSGEKKREIIILFLYCQDSRQSLYFTLLTFVIKHRVLGNAVSSNDGDNNYQYSRFLRNVLLCRKERSA